MTRQQALPVGILLVVVVIALLAWALQLMQSAIDEQEFSLVMTLNGLLL